MNRNTNTPIPSVRLIANEYSYYFKGHWDLVIKLITSLSHIITPTIPINNLRAKPHLNPKPILILMSGSSKGGMKVGGLKDPYYRLSVLERISHTLPSFIPPSERLDNSNRIRNPGLSFVLRNGCLDSHENLVSKLFGDKIGVVGLGLGFRE